MTFEKAKNLLSEYYKENLVGVWIFGETQHLLYSSFPYADIFQKENVFPFVPWPIQPDEPLFFLVGINELYCQFPFRYQSNSYRILIGPVFLGRPQSLEDHTSLSFYSAFSHTMVNKISDSIPVINVLGYISLVRLLMLACCDQAYSEKEIQAQLGKFTFPYQETSPDSESLSNECMNAYLLEDRLMSYVQTGDLKNVKLLISSTRNRRNGKLSDQMVRQALCDMACSTTLVTRAAVRGGMDPGMAYSLSDQFIQQASQTSDLQQLLLLSYKMLFTFTQAMARLRKCDVLYSPTVRKCIAYMSMHYNEALTTEKIAVALHFSPSHLQHIFKRETGQTIQKYLQDIRLSEAKLLLRQTDYSYAAISHMTGFSSQSYFTNIFRRNVGLTPKAFRESDPTHSDFRE